MDRLIHKLVLAVFWLSTTALAQVFGPPNSTATDIVVWNNNSGNLVTDPGSFQILGTTLRGNNVTQNLVVQGGQDSTLFFPFRYGGITVRGADAIGSSAYGGSVTVRGGDNYANTTSGFEGAGWLILRPGAATGNAGGDVIPGHLVVSQTFIIGSFYTGASGATGGLLGCAYGHNQIVDCGAPVIASNGNNYIGVNLSPIMVPGAAQCDLSHPCAANIQLAGYALVQSKVASRFTVGDIACVDTSNPGYVMDNGADLCSTRVVPAAQVGIVVLGDPFPTTSHSVILAR